MAFVNLQVKGRRGDISVTLLVIMVFVIVTTMLVSFLISNHNAKKSFANLEIFENLSSRLNDFYFYIHSGMPSQEAANLVGAQMSGNKLTLNQEDPGKISIVYIVDINK